MLLQLLEGIKGGNLDHIMPSYAITFSPYLNLIKIKSGHINIKKRKRKKKRKGISQDF
jgi:hypothetical protein